MRGYCQLGHLVQGSTALPRLPLEGGAGGGGGWRDLQLLPGVFFRSLAKCRGQSSWDQPSGLLQ